MKYAFVFASLALSLAWSAFGSEFWPWRLLLIWGAVCFAGVALAYAGVGPRVFGKRRDGRISALGWALFWPFHALNFGSLHLFLRGQKRRGSLISPITPRVFLGPRLGAAQARALMAGGVVSVLDVAGELPETALLRAVPNYLSLPALDAGAPRASDLTRGAAWIAAREKEGPVYVHCALGHGRSATFVAAFLIQSGRASTPEQALALIVEKRPGIGLSAAQKRVLERFSAGPAEVL